MKHKETIMIELKAKNEEEAQTEALRLSEENPGRYIIISACFGIVATVTRNLNTFAPSDSCFSWYVFNGKLRTFTKKQRIADQNATPKLS